MSQPALLSVPYQRSAAGVTVEVVTNPTTGAIEQVKTPQGLVNVAVADAYTYYLQTFYDTNVTPKSGGLYGTNAAAFVTWTIQNPDAAASSNCLVVTESRPGLADRQFTYTYTNESGVAKWRLTDNGGLRTVMSWGAAGTGSPATTNIFTEIRSGSTTVSMAQKTYTLLGGHWLLTVKIDGTGSATNVTTYTYNSSNLVETVSYPDGNWQFFAYDDQGRVTTNFSAYLNSPAATPGCLPDPTTNQCKMVEYYYYEAVTGDQPWLQTYLPRIEITRIPVLSGGTWAMEETSCLYRSVPSEDEVDEIRCPSPGAAWNDSANLITKTVRYMNSTNETGSYIAGQIAWQVRPDGTADIYTYQTNANGVVTNIIVQTGAPSDTVSPTNVVDGTQTQTALDTLARVTRQTTKVIVAGSPSTAISDQTVTYSGDPLLRDYQVVDLANRTNQGHYACCGLDNVIDPDGVTIQFSYDTLRRRVASLTLRGGSSGVQLTNILDPANHVLATKRSIRVSNTI